MKCDMCKGDDPSERGVCPACLITYRPEAVVSQDEFNTVVCDGASHWTVARGEAILEAPCYHQ
jgi:NMD protein affecting ribosome stability and mRNA decay